MRRVKRFYPRRIDSSTWGIWDSELHQWYGDPVYRYINETSAQRICDTLNIEAA